MRVLCSFFFLMIRRPPRSTLFPYTRSSDLRVATDRGLAVREQDHRRWHSPAGLALADERVEPGLERLAGRRRAVGDLGDRKSTRLNSSHANISYAVFCLKKKKTKLPSWLFI